MLAKNSSKWKPSGWDKYTKIKHKWKLKANVFSAMFCLKTAATALGFHPRAPDGDTSLIFSYFGLILSNPKDLLNTPGPCWHPQWPNHVKSQMLKQHLTRHLENLKACKDIVKPIQVYIHTYIYIYIYIYLNDHLYYCFLIRKKTWRSNIKPYESQKTIRIKKTHTNWWCMIVHSGLQMGFGFQSWILFWIVRPLLTLQFANSFPLGSLQPRAGATVLHTNTRCWPSSSFCQRPALRALEVTGIKPSTKLSTI